MLDSILWQCLNLETVLSWKHWLQADPDSSSQCCLAHVAQGSIGHIIGRYPVRPSIFRLVIPYPPGGPATYMLMSGQDLVAGVTNSTSGTTVHQLGFQNFIGIDPLTLWVYNALMCAILGRHECTHGE